MSEGVRIRLRGLPEYVRAVTVGQNLRVLIWATDDGMALDLDGYTVTLKIKPPESPEEEWTVDPEGLIEDAPGSLHLDRLLDESGEWVFRVELTGPVEDADERTIRVPPSSMPSLNA